MLKALTVTSVNNVPVGNVTPSTGAFTTLSASGDVTISDKIVHDGDSNTAIRFPVADMVTIATGGIENFRVTPTESIFNETGADVDFRIESDTNTHAFFVDAGNSRVGMGTGSPVELLHLNGGGLVIGGAASSINYSALVIDYNSSTREARIAVGGQSGADGFLTFTTTSGGTEAERVRVKQTGQLRFVPLAADPAGAEAGDVYYNSGTNKLRLYDGSSWVDLN